MGEYRFLSDAEPTDEQLKQLMKEVGIEVRRHNKKSEDELLEKIKRETKAAQERFASYRL